MTVQDSPDFGLQLRADLADFVQRLEGLEIGDKLRLEEEALKPGKRKKPSLGRRLKGFFSGLAHAGRTARRLKALEEDVGRLRGALTTVMEREIGAVGDAVVRGVGNVERTVSSHQAQLQGAFERHTHASQDAIASARSELTADIRKVEQRVQFERRTRQKAFTEFERRLALAQRAGLGAAGSAAVAEDAGTSVQGLLESFYYLLEERYRGTREEIRQRLLVYRPDFIAARERTGVSGPVIDVGCGRGELLEMLQEDGFQCLGIDNNDTQLDAARAHGVPVLHADAIEHLRSLPQDSVLAVTGIHIVEHFPFSDLIRLLQEVARVLRPGGVCIFETPNPRNVLVGATTFHLDPTHVRPLPPEVMQILLETVGFGAVESRLLHPSDTFDYMVEQRGMDRDIARLLFGPQDYAAIGIMG